ncbi:hypothetical protein MLD38_028672 [Melastoma candidum]|uniref:Uncharacterized protein n=1 Tax=Melastoma candidum TaxID=119954 RepID=A0ACB9N7J5_9MYRT|nr:hypothetical protein MLD38_028672 [Melastoma candidum]
MRGSELVPFDPEIERTFRLCLREQKEAIRQQTMENNNQEVKLRIMRDYAQPHVHERSSIVKPTIQANTFEIKPAVITMLQNSSFGGSPSEDPHGHITNFLEICDTFRYNGVSSEAIRMRLFPFSLRDKARTWLYSLPEGSITNWEEMSGKFLSMYFPPSKTIKMRNDITSFRQHGTESLYEAWERFMLCLDLKE